MSPFKPAAKMWYWCCGQSGSEDTSDDRSLSRSLQRRHVYHGQNAGLLRLLPFVVWAVSSLCSGKCSAAILGGQECQALMWLDMLMVDVNVSGEIVGSKRSKQD
ncbi:hypothetical protein DY000_02061302 [Brassica cretica]|uniref:Uncharacterized protein n=1 Tax=Brassica cretica TaxID=69181 RepID=A0ABQ7AW80_BRACR|nr:hypothetical protein DY000_02061302 [Brassica cretica]